MIHFNAQQEAAFASNGTCLDFIFPDAELIIMIRLSRHSFKYIYLKRWLSW